MQHSLKLRKHAWVVGVLLAAFILVTPLFGLLAATVGQPSGTTGQPGSTAGQPSSDFVFENPLAHGSSLCELLNALFSVALTLGIPIAVVFLVLAGFKFVLALGSPEKLTKAKTNIFYTLVGIALFVGAWFLAQVIANTLVQLGGSDFNSCYSR